MKSIRKAILLMIPVLVFPWVASAQNSIYSWTDENGVKHFSDRAPANVDAVSQEMMPQPRSDPSGGAENQANSLNNEPTKDQSTAESTTVGTDQGSDADELSYADQQRQAIAERREAERQQQMERNQLCLQARNQLARIEPGRRVFYTDEDGETTRMDDEERVRLVEVNKAQIAEFCD